MDTHQDRINTLVSGIVNLNQNDTISLTFIIIHTSLLFSEIKNNHSLSEIFLSQIEVLLTLLEHKLKNLWEL